MPEAITAKKEGKVYKKVSERSIERMQEGRIPVYKTPNRPTMHRVKEAALDASDNGRCWWIYEWIMLDLNNRR